MGLFGWVLDSGFIWLSSILHEDYYWYLFSSFALDFLCKSIWRLLFLLVTWKEISVLPSSEFSVRFCYIGINVLSHRLDSSFFTNLFVTVCRSHLRCVFIGVLLSKYFRFVTYIFCCLLFYNGVCVSYASVDTCYSVDHLTQRIFSWYWVYV